jgi:hypothetical protein
VLARIFERVDLSLAPKREIKVQRRSITLMPSDGLLVRLDQRRSSVSSSISSHGEWASAGSSM